MLNMIKNMINQKQDFMEAADLLLENGMDELDDAIILNEGTIFNESEEDIQLEGEDSENELEKPAENDDNNKDENPTDGDMMDEPIVDDGLDGNPDTPPAEDNNDILNDDIDAPVEPEPTTGPEEKPLPLPGADDLPEPVSNVTGEPAADDGLLSMELDLGSNTPNDMLPLPPKDAASTVAGDDILDQRIDSGFGGEDDVTESDDNLLNESMMSRRLYKKREKMNNKNAGDKIDIDGEEFNISTKKVSAEEVPEHIRKKGEELLKNKNLKEYTDDLLDESIDGEFTEANKRIQKKWNSKLADNINTSKDTGYELGMSIADKLGGDPEAAKDMMDKINDIIGDLGLKINKNGYIADEDGESLGHINSFKYSDTRELKRQLKELKAKNKKNFKESTDDLLSEAITIADGADDTASEEPAATDDSSDVDLGGGEAPAEEPKEDNEVTAAVKDKVAEMDASVEGENGGGDAKEKLMNKLSSITKTLEDTKKIVMGI